MTEILEIGKFIAGSVWYVLPFFLASIALSVLVRMMKLDGLVRSALMKRMGAAILLGVLVGAFSPLCSCTVVPVVAGLLAGGVPLAPIMAFWIASPTMDPEILVLSAGILGWPLALARLAASLLLSLGAGYLTWLLARTNVLRIAGKSGRRDVPVPAADRFLLQPDLTPALPVSSTGLAFQPAFAAVQPAPAASAAGCSSGTCALPITAGDSPVDWRRVVRDNWRAIRWGEFGSEVLRESWTWGRWLLLAFAMEALIVRFVPQDAIVQVLGNGSWYAVPLAALLGIPLYMTELSALPVVAGLLAKGMLPGAALAFLIAGPVTTLPAMTAVFGTVNRGIFALYMAVGLGGAVLVGLVGNWVF